MIRLLISILFVVATLNIFSFDVTFKDGLHLKSVGWPERLLKWKRKK